MQRPIWLRGVLWTIGGFLAAAFAFLFWAIDVSHSPNLSTARAAALISARPEFNQYAKLVAVSTTTRGADSLKDCCYSAEFTFLQNGSGSLIHAHAQFFYWKGSWHLGEFWYGEPPHVENVTVGHDTSDAK